MPAPPGLDDDIGLYPRQEAEAKEQAAREAEAKARAEAADAQRASGKPAEQE